jgi:hypothetical protein
MKKFLFFLMTLIIFKATTLYGGTRDLEVPNQSLLDYFLSTFSTH